MKLWIVELANGTRLVVYAEHANAAAAGIRDRQRALVSRVREWPLQAPLRIAFVPARPVDGDGSTQMYFWDGVADWVERPPRATSDALGDVQEAARARDQHATHLKHEHEAGGHESGAAEDCPACLSVMLERAMTRRRNRFRSGFDA